MTVIDWLLDADPAIRWQVLRDLTDAPAEEVAAERARVAVRGLGRPAAGAAGPRRPVGRRHVPAGLGRRVEAVLRRRGPRPLLRCCCSATSGSTRRSERVRQAIALVRDNAGGSTTASRSSRARSSRASTARRVALGAYFGAGRRRDRRPPCSASSSTTAAGTAGPSTGRRASSFHSTICVLEGLLAWEQATGAIRRRSRGARGAGEEYLLERRLLRRRSTRSRSSIRA